MRATAASALLASHLALGYRVVHGCWLALGRGLVHGCWLALGCGLAPGCSPPHGTIGAVLGQQHDGRLFLREVPRGLAAERAGLQEGDEILLIDGRDVRQMTDEDVHRALGGAVGEPVRLTLLREGEVLRITLERTPARRR